MVVGITIATITALTLRRKGGAAGPSFTDPESLRPALDDLLSDPVRRAVAFGILDRLALELQEYDQLVSDCLDGYLEAMSDFYPTAAKLGQELDPMVDGRRAALRACLHARAQLRDLLEPGEWDRLFPKPQR